ncbi:MAG: PD40 domain-containing protein [Planctomycetes bacterium]|nr:PD40 domain-containing protein [Planctomycetota bacterium]
MPAHPAADPVATIAARRLAVLTLLAALGWTFACRPAWSPDGKQVVFPCPCEDRIGLARYRIGDEQAELLLLEAEGRKAHYSACWSDDGRELIVLRGVSAKTALLQVTRRTLDGAASQTFEVETPDDAAHHTILPPVVVGNTLLLGGKALIRVDLDTGATETVDELRLDGPGTASDITLSRVGDAVHYLARTGKDDGAGWELGQLDPKTLARRRLFSSPPACAWQVLPMPAFSPDRSRVALAAMQGEPADRRSAILVFDAGELLHTIELQGDNPRVGPVVWAPDGTSLLATLTEDDDGRTRCSLVETDFAGNAERRTVLLTATADRTSGQMLPFSMQPALSPDGSTCALSTAYLPQADPERSGLLLVDLRDRQRKVTRLPFPKP